MKNGKRPSLRQKKVMKSHGLDPAEWLVVKDMGSRMEVVKRLELKRVGGKPRVKRLEVEI